MELKKLNGMTVTVRPDGCDVEWDHLGKDRKVFTTYVFGEFLLKFIDTAASACKTAEELDKCMEGIRGFYGNYLTDQKALRELADAVFGAIHGVKAESEE